MSKTSSNSNVIDTAWPKISIVTPTYNQGHFIEQTILSVLNQVYPNLEYIIIDGGSTDNTVEIIQKYASQITYWISEPDRGQTDAINKGFKLATGEIFNWLNSDDYFSPGALFEIAKAFTEGIDCVAGNIRNFIEDKSFPDWVERTEMKNTPMETAARNANRQPGTFFRVDAIKSFFPLPESLHFTMDQYIWVSFLLNSGQEKIRQIDAEIVNFRRHESSKTQSNPNSYRLTYSEPFFNDFNSIFYHLSRQFNLQKETQTIQSHFSEKYKPCSYNLPIPHSNLNLVESSVHEYLLELAVDNYTRGDSILLTKTLNIIDKKLINQSSQKRLDALKFKKWVWPIILFRRKLMKMKKQIIGV